MVRQVLESRFDKRAIILPLAIVAVVAHSYLHAIPTGGNDLLLIVGLAGVGVLLGTLSGLVTRVRADSGQYALVKAGWASAGLWVLGMGSRMAFSVWVANGGQDVVARFSETHHITSGQAWTAALVLMAIGEVASRIGVLYVRSRQALNAYAARGHRPGCSRSCRRRHHSAGQVSPAGRFTSCCGAATGWPSRAARPRRPGRSTGHVELGQHVVEMGLDGGLTDDEATSNLPVRQALGDEPHDIDLAAGQPLDEIWRGRL